MGWPLPLCVLTSDLWPQTDLCLCSLRIHSRWWCLSMLKADFSPSSVLFPLTQTDPCLCFLCDPGDSVCLARNAPVRTAMGLIEMAKNLLSARPWTWLRPVWETSKEHTNHYSSRQCWLNSVPTNTVAKLATVTPTPIYHDAVFECTKVTVTIDSSLLECVLLVRSRCGLGVNTG